MNRINLIILSFIMIPLIQSCTAVNKPSPAKRNDPLIGKIINTKTSRQISFKSLIQKIADIDVIYLSEKHDNPDHHLAQHKIIKALAAKGIKNGRMPSIGFEFFSINDTSVLLNFIESGKKKHPEKIEAAIEKDLRLKLGWHTQPDDSWKFYFELLKIARDKNLIVAGLDLDTTLKRRITKKGINGISPLERDQIFSTDFHDIDYREYMFSVFKSAHCGMGNERMQARLYDTWLARNDTMAYAISRLHTHSKGPVIVIVGGGHTEHNLGIINRLPAINQDISQVNIGLKEITRAPSALSDYLTPLELAGYDKLPPADYLWFFQRVSYANPCERFKKILEKMKAR